MEIGTIDYGLWFRKGFGESNWNTMASKKDKHVIHESGTKRMVTHFTLSKSSEKIAELQLSIEFRNEAMKKKSIDLLDVITKSEVQGIGISFLIEKLDENEKRKTKKKLILELCTCSLDIFQ